MLRWCNVGPTGHAGICVLCVPIRILFDYSAHVSRIPLVISISDRDALSYALWQKNRIIVIVTIAVSLANTVAFFYSSCLPSLSVGSPDACGQTSPYLARTGQQTFVMLTIYWIPESLSTPHSSPTSCIFLLC
jgi:hypothetical protein